MRRNIGLPGYTYKAKASNIDFGMLKQEFLTSERKVIKAVRRSLRDRPAHYLLDRSHRFEPCNSTRPGEDLEFTRALSDGHLRRWLKDKRII